MRSSLPKLLLLVGLTACRVTDGTSPEAPQPTYLASGEVERALPAPPAPTDTGRATLTVRPQGDTLMFGTHMISFAPNSVCDPSASTYGPTEWLRPCSTIVAPLVVDVQWWTDSRGFVRVEFKQKLRFHPDREVVLFLHDPKGAPLPSATLLYCPDGGGACVNESATDPALKTFRLPDANCVYRRLRHFSGYNVWA